MGIYEELGLTPVVNADARWTGLGGSLMAPAVLDAMRSAAEHYIDINALQRAAGARIAQLTNNEAAYVSASATAGIVISVLACITRGDELSIGRLPDTPHGRNEILVHSGHRIPFDPAIRLGCGRIVQFGNAYHTSELEMRAAFTERTAAVFYVAGSHVLGALSLEETSRIAHEHGVPVIVDAAAQLPPRNNLWHFTKNDGADLVIFSGGKDLGGPQASGLIVGSAELVRACQLVGPPSPHWPRALKTGKEEIAGLVRAVELYMERDEAAYLAGLDAVVDGWIERFSRMDGVTASRLVPNLDGQPTPRVLVTIDSAIVGAQASDLAASLASGRPSIRVGASGPDSLYLTPETLQPGQEKIIADQLAALIAAGRG